MIFSHTDSFVWEIMAYHKIQLKWLRIIAYVGRILIKQSSNSQNRILQSHGFDTQVVEIDSYIFLFDIIAFLKGKDWNLFYAFHKFWDKTRDLIRETKTNNYIRCQIAMFVNLQEAIKYCRVYQVPNTSLIIYLIKM